MIHLRVVSCHVKIYYNEIDIQEGWRLKMKRLIDKSLIFIVLLTIYISNIDTLYRIVPVLMLLTLSALFSYFDNVHTTAAVFCAYFILCFFIPSFLFFIPLICYDMLFHPYKGAWVVSFLPLITDSAQTSFAVKCLLLSLMLVVYILRHRTGSLEAMEETYHKLRDNTKEISLQLEKQNQELLEKQDYEIHLATVTERNRIARDIHDNVGHLLSRSILQIGALLAINKEDSTKESLGLVKDTLSEAMDSIRNSVHDLHEESINMQTELRKLLSSFTFCPIQLDYDIETDLEKHIKYCFIAVTKEALSNIIKHSNATKAYVTLREHPALFQLVIQDNGAKSSYSNIEGIGIKNMTDRVAALGGNIHISMEKGFRIFISVPKK